MKADRPAFREVRTLHLTPATFDALAFEAGRLGCSASALAEHLLDAVIKADILDEFVCLGGANDAR